MRGVMKTADLIPLILIELSLGDKYGFELSKEIEDKSNQQIQIKQPTLYTILKKLEKSKFISSYWQDSEIGGKRHYYKITDNGRAQLSTLPSFDQCLNAILSEEQENMDEPLAVENEKVTVQMQEINQPYQSTTPSVGQETSDEGFVSIMDLIADSAPQKETIIPADELFKSENIDNQTEIEINKSNTSLLKNSKMQEVEKFAENKGVSNFVEKKPMPKPTLNMEDLVESNYSAPTSNADYVFADVKYVDYQDFKTKKSYIHAKKLAKFSIFKSLICTLYTLLIMTLCLSVTSRFSGSGLFYSMLAITFVSLIAYVAVTIKTNENLRLKIQNNTYNPKFKLRLIWCAILTMAIMIISIIMGVLAVKGTSTGVFAVQNFSNIYAPILLISGVWIDLLCAYLFYKIANKKS